MARIVDGGLALLGRKGTLWGIAIFLTVLHGLLVLQNFPPSSVRTGHPLMSVELHFHLAGAMEGHDFIAGERRLWGYSPRYMAGYPFGLWNSIGTRGYELASTLIPLPQPMAFYLWVVLSSFLPPLFIGLAAVICTGDRRLALLSLIAAVLVWQCGNIVTYFWTSGMIAFPFVESISVLYAALIYRSWTSRGWIWPLAAGLCLGIIFWLHQLVLLSAGLATLAVLSIGIPAGGRMIGLTRMALAGAVAFLVSWPWLILLMESKEMRGYMYLARISGGWKSFVMDFLSDRRYLHVFDRRTLFHVLAVLAVLGGFAARGRDRPVLIHAVVFTALLVCTYAFGASQFLDQTEPYRYLGSAVLFSIIPASAGIRRLVQIFAAADQGGRRLMVCLAVILLPSLTGYGFDVVQRLRKPAHGLNESQLQVVSLLRAKQSLGGRILCEDTKLGNVLPFYVAEEILGGTIGDESVLPQSWAGAGVKSAFGAEGLRGDADGARLKANLRQYNVAVAVTRSGRLQERLAGLGDGCRKTAEIGPYAIFEIEPSQRGYIVGQEGDSRIRVAARPNSITVEGAPRGRFVLKYHTLRTLKSSPGTTLYAQAVEDDPVPFIGVDNEAGLSCVVIRQEY